MQKAIKMLAKLRRTQEVASLRIERLIVLCEQLQVPRVTVFIYAGPDGWYRMQGAYIITSREDVHDHIWYVSPRMGFYVLDKEGKNGIPFQEWDPEADFFTDPCLNEGHTNMDPVERMKDEY